MLQRGSDSVPHTEVECLWVEAETMLLFRSYFDKSVARVNAHDHTDHIWCGRKLRKVVSDLDPVWLGGRKEMQDVTLARILVQRCNRETEGLRLVEIFIDERRSAGPAEQLLAFGRVAIAT